MKNIQYNDLSYLKSISRILDFDNQYNIVKKNIEIILNDNLDCTPIFIGIVGSTAYGIETETSDLDIKLIYIQDLKEILSDTRLDSTSRKYKNQISNKDIKNDIACYELGRYIDLLHDNNPNILELRFIPDFCIVYKHPIWDYVQYLLNQEKLLTKKCYYTFYNYASQQISKATGLNKKINNPIDEKRKSPIDFCNFIFTKPPGFKIISRYPNVRNIDSIPLRDYLDIDNIDQKNCGLQKIEHARDLYKIYYNENIPYKGIVKENDKNIEISNEIRISSIPKDEIPLGYLSYNKDGYMIYCKRYLEYWGKDGWINKRNEERYNTNTSSGQNYDTKNISHCVRLLHMASEIATQQKVIVRRDENQRKEILDIKKGLYSYEDIMKICEELSYNLKELYEKSTLPDDISLDVLENILYKIRKKYYLL